jgi:hypothetical protein
VYNCLARPVAFGPVAFGPVAFAGAKNTIPWFGTAEYCRKGLVADIQLQFYLRLTVSDQVGIIAAIGRACEENSISIDAVLQNPVKPDYDVAKDLLQFVVITNETTYHKVLGLARGLASFSWCKNEPFIMAC